MPDQTVKMAAVPEDTLRRAAEFSKRASASLKEFDSLKKSAADQAPVLVDQLVELGLVKRADAEAKIQEIVDNPLVLMSDLQKVASAYVDVASKPAPAPAERGAPVTGSSLPVTKQAYTATNVPPTSPRERAYAIACAEAYG